MGEDIYIYMQRNKYLDDLGIPLKEYGTNFCADDDKRAERWAEQRKEYGFDSRECWNLDLTFIEWLYCHLMMYIEECNVDLSFHKFSFKGKEYTQGEAIDYILKRLKKYLTSDKVFPDKKTYKGVKNAIKMWAEIYPACWW